MKIPAIDPTDLETKEGPVTVVVSKLDGPAPPPLKPVLPRSARAGERAKARELVAPAWKGFNPGEYQGPDSPASTLALVDTNRVVEMIEDQVLKPSGPLLVQAGSATDLAVDATLAGSGIIYLFEDWLRPHLNSGALEPVLEPWWQRFSGPFLYYPGRRLVPAPLRAFIDFIKPSAA